MDLGIAGRRAFVPAASAGLGLAVADALAGEGVEVAICGRDADRMESAVARVGGSIAGFVADVSTAAGAAAAIQEARDRLGGDPEILILNGPGPPAGTFESSPPDSYRDAVESGLLAQVEMCVQAVPAMAAAGWGRILAISSITVRQPIPNLVLSTMSRTGLTGFLKALALEIAPSGVTVNALQPGLHHTARLDAVFGDRLDDEVTTIPMGKLGVPEEFGRVAAMLCSEHASYVTGTAIPIDGGVYRGLM
jgi:3-oxoacyl-[acyl-carrier protein] reductase